MTPRKFDQPMIGKLYIRITLDTRSLLNKTAKETGITVSQIVRDAIDEYLENDERSGSDEIH